MQNETIGSLFDLIIMATKKVFSNLPMLALMLTIIVSSEIINELMLPTQSSQSDHLAFIDEDNETNSISWMQPTMAFVVTIASVVLSYFAVACLLSSKGNFNQDFSNFISLVKERGGKITIALILQWLLIFIGMILLVIPGIYFMLRTYLIPYIVIYENKGFMEAFERSSQLMMGNKLTTLIFIIITGIGLGVVVIMLAFVFAMLGMTDNLMSSVENFNVLGLLLFIIYLGIAAVSSVLLGFAFPNMLYLKLSKSYAGRATVKQVFRRIYLKWWGMRDLNSRPIRYERTALTN